MAARDRSAEAEAEDGEGFLGRWSRRKAEARTADADQAAEFAEDRAAVPAAGEAERPAFDPATLPDIETLGADGDFSVFMQAGVPSALRTKALRKLWRLKPELANLDGLVDYGEDLTGSFKVVDHLKTAYRVGRGFLRTEERIAAEAGTRPPAEGQPGTEAAAEAPAETEPKVSAASEKPDPPDAAVAGGTDEPTSPDAETA